MDSYDVIVGAVKDYWKVNYPQDVVAFFRQKYSWDDKWERCEELVECHGSDDYENMSFLSDFCEGQTEVKDVVIIPLREVTAFYYKKKIENHESAPSIRIPKRHGRLIDVNKVLDGLAHNLGIRSLDYLTPNERAIVSWFRDAPTVIPASEEEMK